jgi:hypothetical protein
VQRDKHHQAINSKNRINSGCTRTGHDLPIQVSICHGWNVVLMKERRANQREREKEESPEALKRRSERPAIPAQAILPAPVVASMFNRWAA